MTKKDQELAIFISYHESVNQDILARVNLRENSVMIFLGAVAALGAAAIQIKDPTFLLVTPYLTLGISLITAHHNLLIFGLVQYRELQLNKYLTNNEIEIISWDSSMMRFDISQDSRNFRFWGEFGLIIIPSLISLLLNYQLICKDTIFKILLILALLSILISTYLLYFIHKKRKENLDKIKANAQIKETKPVE